MGHKGFKVVFTGEQQFAFVKLNKKIAEIHNTKKINQILILILMEYTL